MKLFPKPQEFVEFNIKIESALLRIVDLGPFNIKTIKEEFLLINSNFLFGDNADIIFLKDKKLKKEEYIIEAKNNKILLKASTAIGAYYAAISFLRLYQEPLYEFYLHDYPLLEIRGVMLDISRSKVPTLKTLKKIVYQLSHMKYNHLELYIEGMSFEYQNFKDEINIYKNYISLKDYQALQRYCKKYFIDFVPNMNGLGHMSEWLKLDKYHYLAEKEDYVYLWRAHREPSTLDVTNNDSIKLVSALYEDLLPYTTSKYFNMNLDEPFELGLGKAKELVEKEGKEKIYLDYVLKLDDIVKNKYHKIPMMWGDVLIKNNDVLNNIDKDIIFIDWGYDHLYDFENHSKLLDEYNIKFINAPGTCTWGNIVGKDIDMEGSIRHAATSAKNHHGLGILVTDWGDLGHLQYFISSYPGLILAAGEAWNNLSKDELNEETKYILGEDIGNIVLKLQTYPSLDEYRGYGSKLFTPIMYSEHALNETDKISYFKDVMQGNVNDKKQYLKNKRFFKEVEKEIKALDNSLEKKELLLAIKLLLILNETCYKLYLWINNLPYDFSNIINDLNTYSKKYQVVWNKRNNPNGFKLSNNRIEWLKLMLTQINGEENK